PLLSMLRPLGLCLLLACAVALTSSAVIVENGLPILWASTTAQLTDMPTQEGVLTPDPWKYLERMSLFRFIIAATDPFMGTMGTNATDSPVWGLPLQLGWLQKSGRLADPTGTSTCGDTMCISPQSWWACINYFVSVLPFLSAVQQGLMGEGVQVRMQVPAGAEDYCTTYNDCVARYPEPMAKWDAFYQGLKTDSTDSTDSTKSDLEKKDDILGLFWDAQRTSLHTSACNARQSHYATPEVSFANSWLNSAEYIAAVHFQSNIQNSVPFMTPLPSRVLKAGDQPPIDDLSTEENHSLKTFGWMKTMNTLMGGRLVTKWRDSMCSIERRAKGRDLLEQLVLNPSFPYSSFLTFMASMATAC
uniref:Protein LEG1 homolog n=1 Tax=Myripristis murdjan TaxID=586833 RepID=A0A667YHD6_9TELE